MSQEKSWWSAHLENKENRGLAVFDSEVEERTDCHVITVSGKLTIDSSPDLLEKMKRSLKRTKCLRLRLADVRYIDSSGVATLIQGYKLSQERKVDFVLVDPSPKVQAIIELSQLHEFFQIETTEGSADDDGER